MSGGRRYLISIYHRSALLLDLAPRETLAPSVGAGAARARARALAIYFNELALVRRLYHSWLIDRARL